MPISAREATLPLPYCHHSKWNKGQDQAHHRSKKKRKKKKGSKRPCSWKWTPACKSGFGLRRLAVVSFKKLNPLIHPLLLHTCQPASWSVRPTRWDSRSPGHLRSWRSWGSWGSQPRSPCPRSQTLAASRTVGALGAAFRFYKDKKKWETQFER